MGRRPTYGDNLRVSRLVSRLEGILELASKEDWLEGRLWYSRAHEIATELDTEPDRAAGIIAALSPNTRWEVNIAAAREFYSNPRARLHTYTQLDKATAILEGTEPLAVLHGPKESNFYRNIANPRARAAVTIDRHAARAALGYFLSAEDTVNRLKRVRVYPKVARAYTELASRLELIPCQLQAIIWLAYRREFASIDSIPF